MLENIVSSDTAHVYLLVHYKMCFSRLELRLSKIQALWAELCPAEGRLCLVQTKAFVFTGYKLHSSPIN